MTEIDMARQYGHNVEVEFINNKDAFNIGYKSFLAGYNKANDWHYVKDGKLPRQDGHTCFSIKVLASNKKWVYYRFDNGKWFCGNKEVKVTAWKEIVLPELKEIK